MTTATTGSNRVWDSRPPKSALRVWTRYCIQWLWGPPLWLLVRMPLIVLALLDVEVPQPSRGDMPKPRWRQRIWIDRERLRLERITDPQAQERELRQLLADHRLNCVPPRPGAPAPLPCSGGKHRLTVADSYFRLLGARRAFGIAHNEFGWVLAENAEAKLPGRLELTCPKKK
ncbi:hypothetical protein ACFOOM_04665 [Streptomyces echinoruber]|uniref:Uncharacterized protein n=1 Tax=Streptomyces echinoruber TaxID=68898 RepID=A0A918S3I0_9ACTN|nr:hypothetical protein [Streptomyces echinoruber]GHA18943.1 hypothetical protein GCM10010389_65980 [Streptomyces echinoruber]